MKIKVLIIASALLVALSAPSFAMDKGGGKMDGHDMGKGEKMSGMDHSGHMGDMIHESKAGMFEVAYHLIDNMAQMKKMGDKMGKKMDMSAHKGMKSNHLMTYFVGHDGKNTTGGKVGFLVTGPDGSKQKAMAMEMKGGYGADIDLKAKGSYTVKTKGVFGGETVMDEFVYEVK